jgi:16S rRNA (adenine1518-N6/adenine1519-N6)-dimethyltransferase
VAERWAAAPGSKEYGIPSVKVAYFATATVVGSVPATVFHPRPRVESALVRLVRHDPPEVDRARLWRLVDAGFAQRRKMLRRSLAGCCDAAAFAVAGIDPTRRAETLDLDEWVALTRTCLATDRDEGGAGPEEGTDR